MSEEKAVIIYLDNCVLLSKKYACWQDVQAECFHRDKTAFFALIGNLYQPTHTYANIQREECIRIKLLPIGCYDEGVMMKTTNY